MKIKFIFKQLCFVLLLIGCKKEKPIDSLELVTPTPIESSVKVVLEMVIPEDDMFQIFYTEDGTANCSEEMSSKVYVKGSNISQRLVFDFPEDVIITYLRIDLGDNPNQGQMTINNFYVQYFDKKFEAKGNKFFEYFSCTEHIAIDYPNLTITPTGKGTPYAPIFYQNEKKITEELQKIQNKD